MVGAGRVMAAAQPCGLCDLHHSESPVRRAPVASTQFSKEKGIMASIRTYRGWWDTSPLDERNERALLSAFVAAIAVWATAFLLALV
jgi:hypothetical protein